MNGAVVFIIGLIAGIIGGVVVSLIVDEINLNRALEEFKNYHTGYYKNICKELNECLEKMDDNHAIDIADLHNDIEKTIWLDDLTIKGLQNQVNELKRTVDYYRRWSLGCWNDICCEHDKKQIDEVIEEANELAARFNEVEDCFYNSVETSTYRVKPDDIQGTVEPDPDEENQPTFNTCDNPEYVDEPVV